MWCPGSCWNMTVDQKKTQTNKQKNPVPWAVKSAFSLFSTEWKGCALWNFNKDKPAVAGQSSVLKLTYCSWLNALLSTWFCKLSHSGDQRSIKTRISPIYCPFRRAKVTIITYCYSSFLSGPWTQRQGWEWATEVPFLQRQEPWGVPAWTVGSCLKQELRRFSAARGSFTSGQSIQTSPICTRMVGRHCVSNGVK